MCVVCVGSEGTSDKDVRSCSIAGLEFLSLSKIYISKTNYMYSVKALVYSHYAIIICEQSNAVVLYK